MRCSQRDYEIDGVKLRVHIAESLLIAVGSRSERQSSKFYLIRNRVGRVERNRMRFQLSRASNIRFLVWVLCLGLPSLPSNWVR